jgi:acid stress-induced BolA-like protein IbaG/YrbA
MALRIGSFDEDVTDTLRRAIEARLPEARVQVASASPGHFEIRVVSEAFAGKSRVQQQQLVYAAIAHLMSGDMAPVHAIDRMETLLP